MGSTTFVLKSCWNNYVIFSCEFLWLTWLWNWFIACTVLTLSLRDCKCVSTSSHPKCMLPCSCSELCSSQEIVILNRMVFLSGWDTRSTCRRPIFLSQDGWCQTSGTREVENLAGRAEEDAGTERWFFAAWLLQAETSFVYMCSYGEDYFIADADSEQRKAEWREIAKKELEDWCKHREEQLEKTKASNRCGTRLGSLDLSLPPHLPLSHSIMTGLIMKPSFKLLLIRGNLYSFIKQILGWQVYLQRAAAEPLQLFFFSSFDVLLFSSVVIIPPSYHISTQRSS